MDDDLDVRGAVDGITEYLRGPEDLLARGTFPPGESRAALAALHRIDGVLQVIFPPEKA
jgi:hypothetical protein